MEADFVLWKLAQFYNSKTVLEMNGAVHLVGLLENPPDLFEQKHKH